MAGAGKSTFVQRINSYLHSQNPPQLPYILNLDPAVTHLPFEANIDIRDTVNYKEVMKQCVAVSIRSARITERITATKGTTWARTVVF
jgi:GTPase SAR1 family protein